jgi:hypothetical protein
LLVSHEFVDPIARYNQVLVGRLDFPNGEGDKTTLYGYVRVDGMDETVIDRPIEYGYARVDGVDETVIDRPIEGR